MLLVWGPSVGKPWSQTSPSVRALPAPHPWEGASLLIGVFFALLNEGNGFRSKAVGHFICAQGDPENVLMVAVVILGNRNKQGSDSKRQPRPWRRVDTRTSWKGTSVEKMVPEDTGHREFPGGSAVRTVFPWRGLGSSLVRELRFRKPCGMPKKKKERRNEM